MSVLDGRKLPLGYGAGSQSRANPWPVILGILLVCFGVFGIAPELEETLLPPEEIQPPAELERGFAPLLAPFNAAEAEVESARLGSMRRRAMGSSSGSTAAEPLIPMTGAPGGSEALQDHSALEALNSEGYIPRRLVIPAIGLDAPIERVSHVEVEMEGQIYRQWLAPDQFAAGWHENSARIGVPGNTVLNGHHNVDGEVFRYIAELEAGDQVLVFNGAERRIYEVVARMILKERYEPLARRLENARWIQPTEDERLTMITCWPYTSNTHRVVVVATPLEAQNPDQAGEPQQE